MASGLLILIYSIVHLWKMKKSGAYALGIFFGYVFIKLGFSHILSEFLLMFCILSIPIVFVNFRSMS